MNIQTAQKIKSVAEFAHYAIGTGSTLKASKEHITSHTKIFAGYEHQWQNIDRAEVLEAFTQAMECTRKADFTRRIELLIETMQNIEIEAERAAAREAAAPTAEEFTREVVRIANRDFGLWVTREQIAAVTADGHAYTAEQVARLISNEVKAAAALKQYGEELTTAQAEYNSAADATEAALNAAVDASPDGLDDTPEFTAYEAAEAALMEKTTALLQACGRYAVELARQHGKPVSDIEALKTMFAPVYSGNTENMHPGRRNELVSKALEIDVSATQAA